MRVKMNDRGGAMTDISLQETETKRSRGRPFAKGQSGNPGGRPRGSINRSTRAAQLLLDGEATALSRKAVELALAGDPTALRLCLDRTVAPRRDRSVELPLPPINSAADILGAIGGRRRSRARRHHPRRRLRAVADDRKLSAGNRRERFRSSLAAVGGRGVGTPSRSLWVYCPLRTSA